MSGIEKVVTKVNIQAQKSDFAYWQTQSYQARLAALEQIRREYHRWRYGAEPRMQKVCRIVKMTGVTDEINETATDNEEQV
jgi:hypothetical protein